MRGRGSRKNGSDRGLATGAATGSVFLRYKTNAILTRRNTFQSNLLFPVGER
jgi:hypothetical protein